MPQEHTSKNLNSSNENLFEYNKHIEKNSLLDNNTINRVSSEKYNASELRDKVEPTPLEKINWSNAHSAKISHKARFAQDMRKQIAAYMLQFEGINQEGEIVALDLNELQRHEVKNSFENLPEISHLQNLYTFWYRLGLNDSLYAEFESPLGLKTTQLIATKYSMHSFCPVWGYRKSQIIRKRYKDYFAENPHLLTDFHPVHMVLTVKHKIVDGVAGFYLGKEFIPKKFYARELIAEFKKMRDNNRKTWKNICIGGTYNTETTNGKNGFHVHLHCLVLQNKALTVDHSRDVLKKIWKEQTGGNVFYKTLYYKEATEETVNHYDMGAGKAGGKDYGKAPKKQVTKFKTHFFDAETWTPAQTSRAIVECLKYNFKHSTFFEKDEKGKATDKIDMPFLTEMLNEGRRVRFCSRFGCLYGIKELNFEEIGKGESEELKDANDQFILDYVRRKAAEFDLEPSEIVPETFDMPHVDYANVRRESAYSANFETFLERFPIAIQAAKDAAAEGIFDATDVEKHYANLVNPFTCEPATYEQFSLKLGFPHTINHRPKFDPVAPNEPRAGAQDLYAVAQATSSIKELTKSMMMGYYDRMLVYEDLHRFKDDYARMLNCLDR